MLLGVPVLVGLGVGLDDSVGVGELVAVGDAVGVGELVGVGAGVAAGSALRVGVGVALVGVGLAVRRGRLACWARDRWVSGALGTADVDVVPAGNTWDRRVRATGDTAGLGVWCSPATC